MMALVAALALGACRADEAAVGDASQSPLPVLALAAAAGTGAPPATRLVPPISAAMGVQAQTWYLDAGDLARIEAAGFGTLRWGISWSRIEQTAGVYDWSEVDAFVQRVRQTSLRSVVIVAFGNELYSGNVTLPSGGSFPAPPETPQARAAYARFAAEAARRYPDETIAWEVWNEPDSSAFWPLAPNPPAYAALASEACSALKTAVPGSTVVGGVGAALPNAVAWQADNIYASLAQTGAKACLDVVSGHAYRMDGDYNAPGPDTVAADLAASRSYLYDTLGFAQEKPLWITEWGFPTTKVAPDLQVAYIMRGTLTALGAGADLTVWYEWRDSQPLSAGHEGNFGINTMYGGPKASAAAMSALAWMGQASLVGPLATGRVDAKAMQLTSGGKKYAFAWLDTADMNRTAQLLVDGKAAGTIGYLPKPFPIKSGNVTLTVQGP